MQDVFNIENAKIILNMLIIFISFVVCIHFKNKYLNIFLSCTVILCSTYYLCNSFINDIKKEDIEVIAINELYNEIPYNERKSILEKKLKGKISDAEYKCLENENAEEFKNNCNLEFEKYYKILSLFFLNYDKPENTNLLKNKIEKKINKSVNNLIILISMKIFLLILLITSFISLINRLFNYLFGNYLNLKQSYLAILSLSWIIGISLLINEIKILQNLEDLNKVSSYISFMFITINIPLFISIIQFNPIYIKIYLLGKEDNIIKYNDYYVEDINNDKVILVKDKIFECQECQQCKKEIERKEISIEELENSYFIFADKEESENIKNIYFKKNNKIRSKNKNKINKILITIIILVLFFSFLIFFQNSNLSVLIYLLSSMFLF